ncbi:hypothetical protein ACN42_g11437 [Penicillium freii]|uniref:Uncharacterized protein n=1 Tax=Penicillium freii TaxID=48697 RepID=A0A101M859_PENFR|nr:hypothetical protein ACN42_g11437 [Penicillium freii]
MLQDRRLALKRIARESEPYEIGTQYHRNFIGGLFSEISHLRSGQPVHTDDEDQLPIDANSLSRSWRLQLLTAQQSVSHCTMHFDVHHVDLS